MAHYGPRKGQTDKYGKPKRKSEQREPSAKEIKAFRNKFKHDRMNAKKGTG